eukprot:5854987-Amphidinium_carterae.1
MIYAKPAVISSSLCGPAGPEAFEPLLRPASAVSWRLMRASPLMLSRSICRTMGNSRGVDAILWLGTCGPGGQNLLAFGRTEAPRPT